MNLVSKKMQRCWNCIECVTCTDRKEHSGCLNCNSHKSDNNPLHWALNKLYLLTEPVVDIVQTSMEQSKPEQCYKEEENELDKAYVVPALSLPCWSWKQWNDGSGALVSPTGESFFFYDLSPYADQNGIEYKETLSSSWNVFWGSFNKFKIYAEKSAKSIFKIKMLQSIPEESFMTEEPEWSGVEDDEISWYVPVLFSADDTFEGIHVNTEENNDWINLYALYRVKTDETILMLVYDGDEYCWDAPVEMDAETKAMAERVVKKGAKVFIEEDSKNEA